ncbi:MAG: BolA/IbaG family iron-sulfur metabolism protein [Gammaproteobacteria bacterium]|nr:BolA/IbaG family iron-sulfur metabolism protein [Gammaproteobacteria bacterium]
METAEIKKLIEDGIANAEAIVTGDGGKYEATVISPAFEGLSMLKEHQLVYKTVNAQIASGELHALTIKAYTPEEWGQNKS